MNNTNKDKALRKAQRDLSKVRSLLIWAGYLSGDDVLEKLNKTIVAVASDLTK